MTNNNISSYNIPKQFLNYINYELSFFEKITTNKKFFFIILNNDIFELNVYESKEEKDDNNNNNKSEYQVIYRSNNLYQFIKNLFILREHLIKNFDKKI
jgi:hypothetical protein